MTTIANASLNSPEHVHNFAGFWPAIHLGPSLLFPTYFIIVSLSFCICLFWLVRRTDLHRLPRNTALDLAIVVMVFGFIGARLFHVLFEESAYYRADLSRIVEFWRGGFVWYGGALGGALAAFVYMRMKKLRFGIWLDLFAPLAALGYALGRVACWFTGCCYGDVCILASGYAFRYPTQIFAVVWELLVLGSLLWLEKHRTTWPGLRHTGQIFLIWLSLHSVGRIIMEAFRGDPRGPAPAGLSISTWISLVLLTLAALAFAKRARSGVI